MTQPSLTLTPLRPGLPGESDASLDVLARVRVPDLPADAARERAPLNLAIVIDRSGSMQGRPIEAAKEAARRIVTSLRAGDRVAVIAYDHDVETIVPSSDASAAKEMLASIAGITSRGMTNLHGGWLAGAEQVAEHLRADAINRVILLSDGAQNKGVTDAGEIARQCAYMAERGVETSTYGVGASFNEDLMTDMAAKGRGNSYYGETAEDLVPAFETELGVLSNTVGKNVRIKARAGKKMTGLELLNQYTPEGDGWRMPNLVADAEVWALFRVKVKNLPADEAKTKALEVEVAYEDADGRPATPLTAKLKLPVLAKARFDALEADSTVSARAQEVEAARLQLDAKQAARRGDWADVDQTVAALRGMAGDNPYVGEVADSLANLSACRNAQLFSKEATFAASAMQSRYAALDEDATSLRADSASKSYTTRRTRQGRHSAN